VKEVEASMQGESKALVPAVRGYLERRLEIVQDVVDHFDS